MAVTKFVTKFRGYLASQMSAPTRVNFFQTGAVEKVCFHDGTSHDKHLEPFNDAP
ncbi:MAG: hypothetical protein JWM08_2445 [Candidatus Angelobacter sp.]|nr:hypothetical protein [Candidatus Angelobacter sp.]